MKNTFLGFPKEKLMQWFWYWLLVGMSTIVLFFLITFSWIGYDVRDKCGVAKAKYEGDCTEALIKTVDDESNLLRERNESIWALGQLGDRRALEVVQKYYTGEIPDREPYDEVLSQYEMKKAIKLLDGGFNAGAFLWRKGFN
jgi:hypothetical protein